MPPRTDFAVAVTAFEISLTSLAGPVSELPAEISELPSEINGFAAEISGSATDVTEFAAEVSAPPTSATCFASGVFHSVSGPLAVRRTEAGYAMDFPVRRSAPVPAPPGLAAIGRLDRGGVIVTAAGDEAYDFVSRYFAPAKASRKIQ